MTGGGDRECFRAAAQGFVAAVSAVAARGGDLWGKPALGVWTVRDLVGHASRSLTTVEAYLAQSVDEIVIRSPLDYLRALRGSSLDATAVAERGREAGAALGEDPTAAVRTLAARVLALVDATPDDAPLPTAFGGATLAAYLPTRTFELAVHTLDLVAAVELDPPAGLAAPVAASLALAAGAAGEGNDAGLVLLALTGRRGLPPGFSIV
jgi:Mycothiol maleylpyruvate isomerase N-terminal domain